MGVAGHVDKEHSRREEERVAEGTRRVQLVHGDDDERLLVCFPVGLRVLLEVLPADPVHARGPGALDRLVGALHLVAPERLQPQNLRAARVGVGAGELDAVGDDLFQPVGPGGREVVCMAPARGYRHVLGS